MRACLPVGVRPAGEPRQLKGHQQEQVGSDDESEQEGELVDSHPSCKVRPVWPRKGGGPSSRDGPIVLPVDGRKYYESAV